MTITDVKKQIRQIIADRHPTLARDKQGCVCFFCKKGREDIDMVKLIINVVKEFAKEVREKAKAA
jgi:Tfp pilus assembly major pilin PilA